jgi:hypothetical protein
MTRLSSRSRSAGRRWAIRHFHTCGSWCDNCGEAGHRRFPWWRPRSYSCFWTLAGRGFYWPALFVVWHREPRGRDALTVCRRKVVDDDGKFIRYTRGWRWHVRHWKIQVPPLQELRRRLLTRCAWCGGRSRKRNAVNHSLQWERPRGRWWRGEPNLFHSGCADAVGVEKRCVCEDPAPLPTNLGYTKCARCDGYWHDEILQRATREAVAIAGMPARGQPWEWPQEVDVRAMRDEAKRRS